MPEPVAEDREHFVPNTVPVLVVDLLELVQVDEDQCSLMAAFLPDRNRVLQLLVEEGAVGEPGQRIEERLHAQLFLQLPLGRDVEEVTLQVQRFAVVVQHDDAFVPDVDDATVAPEQAILDAQRLVGLVGPPVSGENTLAIVRVQRADKEVRIVAPLVDRVAEERLDLLTGEDVGARLVEGVDIDDERQLFDQRAIAPLDLTSVAGLRRIGGLHVRAAVHHLSDRAGRGCRSHSNG